MKFEKIAVFVIVILLLLILGMGNTKGESEKRTRGEVYALSFTSYRDLRDYFENNNFVVLRIKGGTWEVKTTVEMGSLHFLRNQREYFVIIPIGIENRHTGSLDAIHKNTQLLFENIPQNVTIIVSGFSGGSITTSNFKGELLLGSYVPLTFKTTFYYGLNVGYTYSTASVSGLENEPITVQGADRVVITNYISDTSLTTPIEIDHVRQVVFSGVSIGAWNTDPYGYAIKLTNVNNLTIENNAGVQIDENDNQYNRVFGLQVLGYERAFVMENVKSVWIDGTTLLSGHPQEKMETGFFATNVGNTSIKKEGSKYHTIRNWLDTNIITMNFEVTYHYKNVSYYDSNHTLINSTYSDRINGNYTSVNILVGGWGEYRTYYYQGKISLYNLTYKKGGKRYGFNLLEKGKEAWSGKNSAAEETYESQFFLSNLPYETHPFTLFTNPQTEEWAKATVQNYQEVRVHRSVAYTEQNPPNTTNESGNTTKKVKTGVVAWTGSIEFRGEMEMKVLDKYGLWLSHYVYGVAVNDNGTHEQNFIEAVNSTANMTDVDQRIGYYVSAPQNAEISFNGAFYGITEISIVLIALAFARWMWAYIKTGGDMSPEELAYHKQQLRNILIGTGIIFGVIYYGGWLAGIFIFP